MTNIDEIIQRGDVAKYQITITHTDYDQQRDDFYVILHYEMSFETMRIDKEQMFHDEEGNWFMMIPSEKLPTGWIKAETHYMVPDTDFGDDIREEVEFDWLGFVTDTPCPKFASKCPCGCDCGHVVFKRVWRGDANSLYMNLLTSKGEPVKDVDGQQLQVRKHDLT